MLKFLEMTKNIDTWDLPIFLKIIHLKKLLIKHVNCSFLSSILSWDQKVPYYYQEQDGDIHSEEWDRETLGKFKEAWIFFKLVYSYWLYLGTVFFNSPYNGIVRNYVLWLFFFSINVCSSGSFYVFMTIL